MTLDNLQQHWHNEVNQPMPSSELQQVLDTVQRRCAKLERSIHWRDVREILAALFVVAASGPMWPVLRTSRVAALGVLIIVAGAALIMYRLLSARKAAPPRLSTSVLEFARQRLTWLDGQIRLLQTVAWWYVAPISVGCLLLCWGLSGGKPLAFGLLALLNVAVAVLVVGLNRQAVRRELLPVREEVARLIDALAESSTN
jgi:hypothetical protein